MATLYNITAFAASQNIPDILIAANTATGGIYFGAFSIALTIIIIFLLRTDILDAILAASTISFILGFFMMQANMLNFIYVLLYLLIAVFSYVLKMVIKKD